MISLADTAVDAAFRLELRTWLEQNLPPGWVQGRRDIPEAERARYAFFKEWQQTLYRGGWLAPEWPREYGGRSATAREQMIYTEELARVDAPRILDNVGLGIAGPSLIDWGTEAQKRALLPGILSAEQMWCLGFSEPNAGSDLASLRTRADRDGDAWVITGQKVWCSRAHLATWCLLLARTDHSVAKHKGLTALIVPMSAPGMDIVPTKQITGESEFCEVFFEGCRIPADHVLGPVNGGWPVIRSALAHERGTLWATEFKIRLEKSARTVAGLYRSQRARGEHAGQLARLRPRVAQAWIESTVFAAQTLRTLPKLHGAKDPPPDAALQKLFGSEIQQRIEELALELEGPYAQLFRDPQRRITPTDWQDRFLYDRSVTISSGTSEVMRNLLAQRGLGLPRD